jgi:type II/III secretion system protein
VTKYLQTLASAAVLATALGSPAVAQEPPGSPFPVTPAQPAVKTLVPLKVLVVLSRYQGEKKISSMPYTLSVNNDHMQSRLRMGSKVPVLTRSRPDDKNSESFSYQDVGTNIDCYALSTDDGRFRIEITIQDTSVYSEGKIDTQGEPPGLKEIPTFRTFMSSQTLILKDGQSTQFTTATDKVSGEVTKVDVTLTVVK